MEHSSFVDDRESDFGVEVSGTKRHQRIASSPSPSPFPSPLRNKKSRVDDMLDESQQEATCGEAGSSLLLDTSSSHGVAFPPRVDQVLDFGISYTPTQQHLLSSGNYFQPIENQPFNDGIEQIRYRHAKDSSNYIEAPTIDPLALYQPGRIAPLDSARNGSDQGSADPSQIHQKYSLQGLPIHPQFQQGVQWHPSTMHFSSLPYQLPETTRVPVQLGPGAQIQILIPQIGRPFSDRIHLLPGPMAGYQTAPSPRNISPGIPLSLNCDGDELSEYQILVRQQLEIFEASQEDVSSNTQGRKKQLVLGQAGIRCKHCSPFPLRQRGKGAIYYPTRLQGVYQASQNMAKSHLCESCQCIPLPLKHKLCALRKNGDSGGGGKQYWAYGAKTLGLQETENGLKLNLRRVDTTLQHRDVYDMNKSVIDDN